MTTSRPKHVVLTGADSEAFQSLTKVSTTREERFRMGKALRKTVPRRSLGQWEPPADRPDPIELINASHQGRVEALIPVRVARMIGSPYGFLRGTAVVMAEDVAKLPSTGITPVVCGDAHLGNFGFYGSPEGELVIDLNDFDEAHPGAWEWDLRRLAAAVWVAGRENGQSEKACEESAQACVRAYREQIRSLARRPLLARSFDRLDVDTLHRRAKDDDLQRQIKQAGRRARKRTSDRAVPRFVEEKSHGRQIVEEPPLIVRVPEEMDQIGAALDSYLDTLQPHWRRVLGGYTLLDVAHKVVGVGSVGLRAYVALLQGSDRDDVVFLQMKQARRSVLAPYVHGDRAWHDHQGQRVVAYQQALQTVSDPLLGWTEFDGRQYYVRQFRNMKGTIPLDSLTDKSLTDYARIVGALLAKGHARTSGASMIAGYLGKNTNVDEALARFAKAYADQTEADHAQLVKAVRAGRIPCDEGALDKIGSAFRPG